jgi:hypothetical protein
LNKYTYFFQHEIYPAKNIFGAFERLSFISSNFLGDFKKTHQIFPAQNLSTAKFVIYNFFLIPW